MKRYLTSRLIFIFIFVFPIYCEAREYMAEDYLKEDYLAEDYLSEADVKYNIGGLKNYHQSLNICLKGLTVKPDDYDLLWRSARACRYIGLAAKKLKIKGWRDICAKYGQKGMKYSLRASKIEPNKPHGYYYYGFNVALYADGVDLSDLTLSLKQKTQASLEFAYKLNKLFDDAGPMVLLGRYWTRVPWPFKDNRKALEYYREYQASTNYVVDRYERALVIAELLVEINGKRNLKEAKGLLENIIQSNDTYFKEKAKILLKKINQIS